MELDLFPGSALERITLDGGELVLINNWLNPAEAESCFSRLRTTAEWEQSKITLAGKQLRIPRLNAWYGDEGKTYTYSGKRFEALPWIKELVRLKSKVQLSIDRIESGFWGGTRFEVNSALLNLYRDGADSVGWHSDNERELGPRPQIASVSLGETRRFLFKHRRNKLNKVELTLRSGSLLLMLGDVQRHWLHSVPKTRKPVGERINITFRQVVLGS